MLNMLACGATCACVARTCMCMQIRIRFAGGDHGGRCAKLLKHAVACGACISHNMHAHAGGERWGMLCTKLLACRCLSLHMQQDVHAHAGGDRWGTLCTKLLKQRRSEQLLEAGCEAVHVLLSMVAHCSIPGACKPGKPISKLMHSPKQYCCS